MIEIAVIIPVFLTLGAAVGFACGLRVRRKSDPNWEQTAAMWRQNYEDMNAIRLRHIEALEEQVRVLEGWQPPAKQSPLNIPRHVLAWPPQV